MSKAGNQEIYKRTRSLLKVTRSRRRTQTNGSVHSFFELSSGHLLSLNITDLSGHQLLGSYIGETLRLADFMTSTNVKTRERLHLLIAQEIDAECKGLMRLAFQSYFPDQALIMLEKQQFEKLVETISTGSVKIWSDYYGESALEDFLLSATRKLVSAGRPQVQLERIAISYDKTLARITQTYMR